MKGNGLILRYMGFENNKAGGRRFDFRIGRDNQETEVSVEVPAPFFVGDGRISFQEAVGISYETLKQLLAGENTASRGRFVLTRADVEQHRQQPKTGRRS